MGEKDFIEMAKIPFPKGLSQEDKTVIYLALFLEKAMVIRSDKLVRSFAASKDFLGSLGLVPNNFEYR